MILSCRGGERFTTAGTDLQRLLAYDRPRDFRNAESITVFDNDRTGRTDRSTGPAADTFFGRCREILEHHASPLCFHHFEGFGSDFHTGQFAETATDTDIATQAAFRFHGSNFFVPVFLHEIVGDTTGQRVVFLDMRTV